MGFTSSGVILGSGSGSFTPLYVKLVVSACSSPSFTFVGITFTFTLSSNASDCDQQCALLEQWHEFDKHVSPLLQMNRFEELLRRIKRVTGTGTSKMGTARRHRCEPRPGGKFYRGILRFGSGGTGS